MSSKDRFNRIVRIKGNTFTVIAEVNESESGQIGSVFMTISPAIQGTDDLFDSYLPDLDEFSLFVTTPSSSVYATWAEAANWGGQETAEYLEENLPLLIDFLDAVEAGTVLTD